MNVIFHVSDISKQSQDSSVIIVIRLKSGQLKNQDLSPGRGEEILLYSAPSSKPTQSPIQKILGVLSLGIKQFKRDHSPLSKC
jgi:hypothetical protein